MFTVLGNVRLAMSINYKLMKKLHEEFDKGRDADISIITEEQMKVAGLSEFIPTIRELKKINNIFKGWQQKKDEEKDYKTSLNKGQLDNIENSIRNINNNCFQNVKCKHDNSVLKFYNFLDNFNFQSGFLKGEVANEFRRFRTRLTKKMLEHSYNKDDERSKFIFINNFSRLLDDCNIFTMLNDDIMLDYYEYYFNNLFEYWKNDLKSVLRNYSYICMMPHNNSISATKFNNFLKSKKCIESLETTVKSSLINLCGLLRLEVGKKNSNFKLIDFSRTAVGLNGIVNLIKNRYISDKLYIENIDEFLGFAETMLLHYTEAQEKSSNFLSEEDRDIYSHNKQKHEEAVKAFKNNVKFLKRNIASETKEKIYKAKNKFLEQLKRVFSYIFTKPIELKTQSLQYHSSKHNKTVAKDLELKLPPIERPNKVTDSGKEIKMKNPINDNNIKRPTVNELIIKFNNKNQNDYASHTDIQCALVPKSVYRKGNDIFINAKKYTIRHTEKKGQIMITKEGMKMSFGVKIMDEKMFIGTSKVSIDLARINKVITDEKKFNELTKKIEHCINEYGLSEAIKKEYINCSDIKTESDVVRKYYEKTHRANIIKMHLNNK
jgi:hypothetical protein